jgi:23S rRNA (pseudouridine1915-N3)-methyltransferase
MKFRFLWVGRTKDRNWLALQDEYLQRLSHFVRVDVTEVRDSSSHEGKDIEGKRIMDKLNPNTFVCLLDVSGEAASSHRVAGVIQTWQNRGTKEVTFVIGGAQGVSAFVAERAECVLSLSFMTFTHEMARVIMLEQLYRAFTIINGFPYQK